MFTDVDRYGRQVTEVILPDGRNLIHEPDPNPVDRLAGRIRSEDCGLCGDSNNPAAEDASRGWFVKPR